MANLVCTSLRIATCQSLPYALNGRGKQRSPARQAGPTIIMHFSTSSWRGGSVLYADNNPAHRFPSIPRTNHTYQALVHKPFQRLLLPSVPHWALIAVQAVAAGREFEVL